MAHIISLINMAFVAMCVFYQTRTTPLFAGFHRCPTLVTTLLTWSKLKIHGLYMFAGEMIQIVSPFC